MNQPTIYAQWLMARDSSMARGPTWALAPREKVGYGGGGPRPRAEPTASLEQ